MHRSPLFFRLATIARATLTAAILLCTGAFSYAQPTANDTGDGSREAPYSVEEALNIKADNSWCYVKGYIVGYVNRSISNCVFGQSGEGSVKSNLLLADDSLCTSSEHVLPVELPTGAVRNALNLNENPSTLHRRVALSGQLSTYFSVNGLRSTSSYSFLDDEPVGPGPTPTDTVWLERVDTVWQTRIDTLWQTRVDTLWQTKVDTVVVVVRDTLCEQIIVVDTVHVPSSEPLPAPTVIVRDGICEIVSGHPSALLFYRIDEMDQDEMDKTNDVSNDESLDGLLSIPVDEAHLYTGPFSVSGSCRIMARAVLVSDEAMCDVVDGILQHRSALSTDIVFAPDGRMQPWCSSSAISIVVVPHPDGSFTSRKVLKK